MENGGPQSWSIQFVITLFFQFLFRLALRAKANTQLKMRRAVTYFNLLYSLTCPAVLRLPRLAAHTWRTMANRRRFRLLHNDEQVLPEDSAKHYFGPRGRNEARTLSSYSHPAPKPDDVGGRVAVVVNHVLHGWYVFFASSRQCNYYVLFAAKAATHATYIER